MANEGAARAESGAFTTPEARKGGGGRARGAEAFMTSVDARNCRDDHSATPRPASRSNRREEKQASEEQTQQRLQLERDEQEQLENEGAVRRINPGFRILDDRAWRKKVKNCPERLFARPDDFKFSPIKHSCGRRVYLDAHARANPLPFKLEGLSAAGEGRAPSQKTSLPKPPFSNRPPIPPQPHSHTAPLTPVAPSSPCCHHRTPSPPPPLPFPG